MLSNFSVGAVMVVLAACSVPRALSELQSEGPSPELGRPGWVCSTARAGSWIGAGVGAVGSVVLLPLTYPVSLLVDEPLSDSKGGFCYAPIVGGASVGHFLFGAPADALHFIGYRAWVTDPPSTGGYTPMKPPVGPKAEEPAKK